MPRALVTSAVSWRWSMDQPTTLRLRASSTTQQSSLPSRVLGDVGNPELVGFGPGEVSVDEVTAQRRVGSVVVVVDAVVFDDHPGFEQRIELPEARMTCLAGSAGTHRLRCSHASPRTRSAGRLARSSAADLHAGEDELAFPQCMSPWLSPRVTHWARAAASRPLVDHPSKVPVQQLAPGSVRREPRSHAPQT